MQVEILETRDLHTVGDLLLFRRFKSETDGAFEEVLRRNRGLAEAGVTLPLNYRVTVDIRPPGPTTRITPFIRLFS
jgi:phage tail protein X